MLDLSRVLAGPFAATVLADLGADVVKVERPGSGDDTRAWGPPFLPGSGGDRGDAAYFAAVNRDRRSLTLDLAHPDGTRIAAHLVGAADVVLENFLPRHLARLGLDRVRETHPDVVWVSVRGAGGDGPDGDRPGYDAMVQARSGLMSVTGHHDTGPVKVGVAVADVVAGLYAAVAALAGLLARATSGSGPTMEVGLLEAAVTALVNQAGSHLVAGTVPGPTGNEHPSIAPYGPVACADRPLVVGAGNDAQFARLCRAVGRDDLAADPRFATNADRLAHRAALDEALEATLSTRDATAWRTLLDEAGVPTAPVNDLAAVVADPQVRATGLIAEVAHESGPLRVVGAPLRVDGRRLRPRRAPPTLGQHTGAVLGALGLDPDTVAALRADGVV